MFRLSRYSHQTFSTFQRATLKNNNTRNKLIYLQTKNKTGGTFSSFSSNHGAQKLLLLCVGGTFSLGMFSALKQSNRTVHAATVVNKETDVQEPVEEKEEEIVIPELPEFPEEVQYLLIGGGTASYSAMRSILKTDVDAKILIISEETQTPYMRPPLSKELWFSEDQEAVKHFQFMQWNGKTRDIFFEKPGFFCKPNQLNEKGKKVAIANARKVVELNANDNIAILDNGVQIRYKKCLIATGGTPKNLPAIKNAGVEVEKRTTVFRTVDDFLKLNEVTDNVGSVTVIGGGFMGSELSCALGHKGKKNGFEVNQIFPESGNMGMVLPEYLTKWATNKVRQEGVNVVTEAMVSEISMDGDKVKITTKSNDEIKTDHVVVAVGLGINTDLANSAGIEVDEKFGGYRVNAELQARSNIWVAGDAACFYDVKLGRRRVEHHDHAVVSGRLAGENMTGAQKHYFHQSMFWSDLGPDVGYEAIGLVDSKLPTVGVFAKATERDTPKAAAEEGLRSDSDEGTPTSGTEAPTPNQTTPLSQSEEFGKGVVFYLRDSKVVGVLLWNVFGRMPVARKVIRDQQAYEDYSELAKLFKIHSED